MIYALILLASLANAQEVSTGAAISLLDEVRISNLGKDTRDLISGRYRQTGKPTFAGGFCFADGTCQTTAAVAATVDKSTWSAKIVTPSGSATALGVCVATVSVTLIGSTMTVWGAGAVSMNAAVNGSVGVLEDGSFLAGETSAKGMTQGVGAGSGISLSFSKTFTGLVAGAHNYCVGFFADGSNTFSAAAMSEYQFGVREESGLK